MYWMQMTEEQRSPVQDWAGPGGLRPKCLHTALLGADVEQPPGAPRALSESILSSNASMF
jgi:hypothetical protein